MICLTPKPSQKTFGNDWSFFMDPIKLRPSPHPLAYTIWGILENNTNATSHPNIGSLKTAIEEEWNEMSEEFILKACNLFWRHVDIIIEKKMVTILGKFTVLCLSSYFVVYFFKSKWILFYNRIVHYHTRIFLILLPHPVYCVGVGVVLFTEHTHKLSFD